MQAKCKKPIILVHGAWHHAGCWHKVTPLLEKAGYDVFAPDLPGHGKNTRRPFRKITLRDYTDCIGDLIESHNLQNLTMLGHSMAGIVITQVAEKMPSRIDRLLYLAAFIPQNGCSLFDEAENAASIGISQDIFVDPDDCEIALKLSKKTKTLFYNTCSKDDGNAAILELGKEPLRPFADPVKYTQKNVGSLRKTYIECTQDNTVSLEDQRRMQKHVGNFSVKTLSSDHSPFLSAPEELVDIILD